MTDAFAPDPTMPGPAARPGEEVEVDLAAFLPDGVELGEPEPAAVAVAPPEAPEGVDLEALSQIERDLDAVDAAIAALDAGTYGIDASTGEPIDDDLLAADPTRLS